MIFRCDNSFAIVYDLLIIKFASGKKLGIFHILFNLNVYCNFHFTQDEIEAHEGDTIEERHLYFPFASTLSA